MNNNSEKNDFFGFSKVKWLQLTGEMDKSVRYYHIHVKFSEVLMYQKLLKSVNF